MRSTDSEDAPRSGDAAPAALATRRELRFEAADLGAVEEWLRDAAARLGFSLSASPSTQVDDTYLDTTDLRFLRAGYALRISRQAGEITAALGFLTDRPDATLAGREFAQPLSSNRKSGLFAGDGPVSRRVRALCRESELEVKAGVRVQREVYLVGSRSVALPPGPEETDTPPVPSEGDAFAAGVAATVRISLERDRITNPHGCTNRLSVVKLEGDEEALHAFHPITEQLRRACDLEESTRSTFQWALEAVGIAADHTMSFGEAVVDPRMTVGQIADAVLRRQLASYLWHEPGTRLGDDPEHLHDMRVAGRRMRAALQLFHDAFPAGEADDLRSRLREIGRRLGEVRDLDVFLDELREMGRHVRGVDPASCEPLFRHLARRRTGARAQLMKALDGPSFAALKRALARRLQVDPKDDPPEAEQPIAAAGPELIRSARRRVVRQGRRLGPDAPAGGYHELRIRGKRLRYALEFLEGVYGPPARDLVELLVEMQDRLGLMQDARVAIESLRALTTRKPAGFTPETWVALGELIQLHERRAAEARAGVPRLLRRLEGKRWRALRSAMSELATAEDGAEGRNANGTGDGTGDATKNQEEEAHGTPADPPRHRRGSRSRPVA